LARDAKFIAVGRRLVELRQVYIVVAAGQRRSWPVFHDRVGRLIDATSEAARVADVDVEALNAAYRHGVDGLRIYEKRSTIGAAEIRIELEHVTRTLIAFWQF
jgi:hypothetical protein